MAKRRDYKAEYARRNQLAQDAGWKSIGQQRHAHKVFDTVSPDVRGKWVKFLLSPQGRDLNKRDTESAFRAFYKGLIDKRTNSQTGRTSDKAEWFVEWTGYVDDYDTWLELYGDA